MLDFQDVVPTDADIVTRHRFAGASGPEAERAAFGAWVARRISSGLYIGRLARCDGAVVAGAGIVLLDWGPTRGNLSGVCGRIVAVYTEPTWRRRGLAGVLVRQAMDHAGAQACAISGWPPPPQAPGCIADSDFDPTTPK